jgi:peptide deformylase
MSFSEEHKTYEEGCLSVPGVYDEVDRPAKIRVRALNLQGDTYEFEADGLLAVCVQHELDHLNGKVFVQHLSLLKQTRLKAKLRKEQRELERA